MASLQPPPITEIVNDYPKLAGWLRDVWARSLKSTIGGTEDSVVALDAFGNLVISDIDTGDIVSTDELPANRGDFLVGYDGNFRLESGNIARTSLGVGSGDSPTFEDISITDQIVAALAKIGDIENGNYIEVESDGSVLRRGNATVWEDIQTSLLGRRLSSTAGKVDYNYDENSVTFQPSGSMATANDRVVFNIQVPHSAIEDGNLNLHIHFEQVNSNKIEFRADYRIQDNGAAKQTTWTEINCNTDDNSIFTYVSGTLNQIVKFPSIDLTGIGVSAVVQFRLVREDATVGDVEVIFVDCHVERDSGGSRSEYSK